MSEQINHERYSNDEPYTPTEAVEQLLTFNPQLLDKLQSKLPEVSGLDLVREYCSIISDQMAIVEPDAVKSWAATDGNNITSAIIMHVNFDGGGDDRKFIESGIDLEIARDILKNKAERKYGNLSVYKLWAGLYLDLRAELFDVDQSDQNTELINQLRETIAS